MGISKKYLDRSQRTCYFKPEELSRLLQKLVPHIVFAYLMGSARNGTVNQGSDLDLAVFLNRKPNLPLYDNLKGRLLFTRNQEIWLTFYSRTCREVEHQMFHYEKQRRYRLEARV
jgi:predicted nucleotidyltransferase